jgi:hypothetical protein
MRVNYLAAVAAIVAVSSAALGCSRNDDTSSVPALTPVPGTLQGSFVGVTSVPQPDGAQRATEIHVFPEELRGTGEGSYLMHQQGGGGDSRMSNGTVPESRMTNGAASRLTNGAAGAQSGGTLTVNSPAPLVDRTEMRLDLLRLDHRT